MRRADVVVIGGSAAGIPAAMTARPHYPIKSVLLIRREPQVLVPCGIPYIFGAIGSYEADLIPDATLRQSGIDLLVGEVTGIGRKNRVVTTTAGGQVGYDRLVLAVGSLPIVPAIPGNTAFAAAGLTERAARDAGYRLMAGQAAALNRHPGCMPGAENLKVKLVFEAGTGVILGGQIAGAASGGEMINAISACINQRMTADDIATFQPGTHPGLTASPISYQLVNAAEAAIASAREATAEWTGQQMAGGS
mgnify:CR=1 FL=1